MCEAEYTLTITSDPGNGGDYDFLTRSIGDWGRRVSVHMDGFSRDGQHVFGVLSEGGAYSFTTVLNYDRMALRADLIQIKEGLPRLRAANCGASFAVVGTTDEGRVVLEPNTANACHIEHRWVMDLDGNLRDLAKGESFSSLYSAGAR
jgi:hypothetical protein